MKAPSSRRAIRETYLIGKHPADVPEIVAVDPVVRIRLHPPAKCRDALGADDRVGVAVAVHKDPA